MVNRIRVANTHITAANKEAMWTLPKGCKWFTLQCRTAVDVRIAFDSGHVESSEPPYFTLKSGTNWNEQDLDIKERLTIYFAAASAVWIEALIGITEEVL